MLEICWLHARSIETPLKILIHLTGKPSASVESAERCCLCSTTLDVAETPLDDAELLRQLTSPSLEGNNSGNGNLLATAARALDVTTVISRASSHTEEVASSGFVTCLPLTSAHLAFCHCVVNVFVF